MSNAPAVIPEVNLPAIVPGKHELSYADMYQLANIYASSSLFPGHLRDKPADCFIVVQLAERLKADHLAIAQNTYVVQGKPGMEAKMIIALINRSGQFRGRLRFRLDGEGNKRTATAHAIDNNGELCESSYSLQTAMDEGLVGKPGSKWKTMADLMLQYRAATQFSRLYCPDVTMGMAVLDDDRNIIDGEIMPSAPEPINVEVTAEAPSAPAPEAEAPKAEPKRDPELERMARTYDAWPKAKQEAYKAKMKSLRDEGMDVDDARKQAFEHTDKYFQ